MLLDIEGELADHRGEVASWIEDLRADRTVVAVVGLAGAVGQIGHQAIVDVQLAAQHRAFVLAVHVGPVRVDQRIAARRARNGRTRCQADATRGAVNTVIGAVQIGRQPRTFAAPVQCQRTELYLLALLADGAVTITVGTVEADAELLVGTEAATHIHMGTELSIGGEIGTDPQQRLLACALGDQVDAATDRTTRRHAVEQRGGALQHFDALEHFRRGAVVGRHAAEAIEGGVAGVGGKASDRVVLAPCAGDAVAEHRGVGGGDDVGQVLGLAVADEGLGIADRTERRVHEILVAEQADTAAGGHLTAGIVAGHAALFLHLHRGQGGRRGFGQRGARCHQAKRERRCAVAPRQAVWEWLAAERGGSSDLWRGEGVHGHARVL